MLVGIFFNGAEECAPDGLERFEERGQGINHLRGRLGHFGEQQRFPPFQHFLSAERIALFTHQVTDFTRGELFPGWQFGVEEQGLAQRHFKQRTHRHHHECLFIFHSFLQRFQ